MNPAYLEELRKILDDVYKNNMNLTEKHLNLLKYLGKATYQKNYD